MNDKKIPENIFSKTPKSNTARYFQMLISLFFSALLYNYLIEPSRIATGGVNGVAVILKYLLRFNPAITIFTLSASLLVFSYIFLGKEKTKGTLVASIAYPLFVHFTKYFAPLIQINLDDMLVISIFIGLIGGLCNGLL